MKNIKEAEELTGISRQNIRYYEKMGLLNPKRDAGNGYRKYDEEDIGRLKAILLFRKLDMPLEEIRKLLDHEIDLQQALDTQKAYLQKEQQKLEAALAFCDTIQEQDLAELDINRCLQEIEKQEKSGNTFADILHDYKAVAEMEKKRAFTFWPDDFCTTPRQMTDELCRYANENNLDLVITKEGLMPEFTLDGIEYRAVRIHARGGMAIHAEMIHPEDYIPQGMSEKRYSRLRMIVVAIVPLACILVGTFLWALPDAIETGDILGLVLMLALLFGLITALIAWESKKRYSYKWNDKHPWFFY
jgi:DNA-binding transcriptional MerR regulator